MRTFGIRRNEKIACHVTVRGEKALNLIVRAVGGVQTRDTRSTWRFRRRRGAGRLTSRGQSPHLC